MGNARACQACWRTDPAFDVGLYVKESVVQQMGLPPPTPGEQLGGTEGVGGRHCRGKRPNSSRAHTHTDLAPSTHTVCSHAHTTVPDYRALAAKLRRLRLTAGAMDACWLDDQHLELVVSALGVAAQLAVS